MTESTEKQTSYFGTYFDRDSILRFSRWADIVAWVTLTIYILTWLLSLLLTLSTVLQRHVLRKRDGLSERHQLLLAVLYSSSPRRFLFLRVAGGFQGAFDHARYGR